MVNRRERRKNALTNTIKLKEIVQESGLKKSFIAQKLGLSLQGYLNKENGLHDFTSSQILILKELLHLTQKEVADIFLSKS